MDTTKVKGFREQVKRFRRRFAQGCGGALGNLLGQAELECQVERHSQGCRNRLYPPLVTLGLFIDQVMSADQSCQDAVARGVSARVSQGDKPGGLNNGPYCKARKRLPQGLLKELCEVTGRRMLKAQPPSWRWRGREVKLIDGVTMSMPDTPANQQAYPQVSQQKAGIGFPIVRMVGIISLGCGAILEWALGPCEGKKSGETSMLWNMSAGLGTGDIVLADRYYAGYFMLARLLSQGVDVVTRQHQLRHTRFQRGKRLGKCDHVVLWARPARPKWMDKATYAAMPETLRMRECRVGGWILVSSLCDGATVSKKDLLDLYGWRWHIELDFRAIKVVMQMDVLRCKTPEMIEKEITAHLLAYNLVRSVMAQAAALTAMSPRQLSFKGALQQLRAFERNLRHGKHAHVDHAHHCLLTGIARLKLPHRPGRVEPRALKRRGKNLPFLTQPRATERARLQAFRQRHLREINSLR
jgi:hypothetical protein